MKLILIIAIITLLFLPVLAIEPVNVGGIGGHLWLRNPANTEQDLWTWGGLPAHPPNQTNNQSYYYVVYPYYAYPYYSYYYYNYPYSLPPTSFYAYPMSPNQ